MASIDQQVVEVKLNAAQFLSGIQPVLNGVKKLESSLKMDGATKGLEEIDRAAKKVSLDNVGSSAEAVGAKFKAMQVVAVTALATVTHAAISAGTNLVKSLTLDPVLDGFREYETNLNSIQTILANTSYAGTTLKDVTDALSELNHYSDQTIYNFAEMAKNIGTFTAAGVSLDESTAAIKGIANLAAVSGSNSAQASSAMYQLSQALAAGRATLEDWNSVVNAGMGGKVFQDALIETAKVHGVAVDEMIKKEGSFRLTLQNGWLTSGILTETLQKFTGDLSKAQLKSMGYTDEQIVGIQKMAKTAVSAATEVKTFSQLLSTLQESAGSGWASTWQTIFGDFEEAKALFTNVNNVLGGFIDASTKARNKILSDWKELGGRTVLIEGIGNAFNALVSVIKPVGEAFRSIFPAATGQQLFDLTKRFADFTKTLQVGAGTADKIKRTFAGVFAIFGIAIDLIRGVGTTFAEVFKTVAGGSGDILSITASVGDFLVGIRQAVHEGTALQTFFKSLGKIISVPINAVKAFIAVLADAADAMDFGAAGDGLSKILSGLEPFVGIGNVISAVWNSVGSVMRKVWSYFSGLYPQLTAAIGELGNALAEGLTDINFDSVLAMIQTGLLAVIVKMVKDFIDSFTGGDGGIFSGFTNSLEALQGTLEGMQNALNAAALLEIAVAVGILALSIDKLAKIDSAGLKRALKAITVMFAQLFGSIAIFQQMGGYAGFAKLPIIAAGLILIGAAINILVGAVERLAALSWDELKQGLEGLAAVLAMVGTTVKLMPNTKGMITTGAGLILLAAAIKILVGAVTELGGMDWDAMKQGLIGVAGLLGALALYTKLSSVSKGGIIQGAGFILLAAGIRIMADAVAVLGGLGWEAIGKGLVGMAGGLAIMAAALNLVPPSSVLSAAAIFVVSASLGMMADAIASVGKLDAKTIGKGLIALAGAMTIIAVALALLPPTSLLSAAAIFVVASSLSMIGQALTTMGGMSWEEIAKSLIVLAGSLTIIGVAVAAMVLALPGAAALVIVTAALTLLTPVLIALGSMSWEAIGKGLLTLAAAFAIIGVAGLLLAPIVPSILALGAAVALLGVGMLAAGAGTLAFAMALTALAVAGTAGTAAIIGIVKGLIGLIPELLVQIAKGLGAFAKALAAAAPSIFKAMTVVLTQLLNAIGVLTPKIVKTLLKLIVMLIQQLAKAVPKMVTAGMQLITGLLNGVAKKIGGVITAAVNVIVAFVNGITKNLPKIIDAGVKLVLGLINGVADAIRNNSEKLGAAGANLATAIVDGMIKGLVGGASKVAEQAKSVANKALNAAKQALGIHSPSKEFEKIGNYVNAGFVKGLKGNSSDVQAAFNTLRYSIKDMMRSTASDVKELTAKLKELNSARVKDEKAIKKTTAALKKAKKEHALMSAAYSKLTKNLVDEKDKLKQLANQYDKVAAKLATAQQTLADAKQTRDDYNASITDQYADLPDLPEDTTVSSYTESLKQQIEDTTAFATALQQLRDFGLNDTLYEELLSKGTDALPFVQNLVAAGKEGVSQLDDLQEQLEEVSSGLGKTASTELYQAAVDSAAGLVAGLKKQEAAIEKQMTKIANKMVKAIKKALGIKSPSREFAKVGVFSAQGLVNGLEKTSKVVSRASADVGVNAVNSLSKSLSNISQVVPDKFNLNPTIAPKIDLSQIENGSDKINSLLGTDKTYALAGVTYSAASSTASGFATTGSTVDTTGGTYITFNQTNTSPKALSASEIYRTTKNQLTTIKGTIQS